MVEIKALSRELKFRQQFDQSSSTLCASSLDISARRNHLREKAAMICEQCDAPMIEKLPARQREEAGEEKAIIFECPQCGHTEYQRLIASFWRRLAA